MIDARRHSLLGWILCLVTTAAAAQDARTEFTVESRLLDRDLELYSQARQRENTALRDFRSLSESVDAALMDPNAELGALRELEARLSAARETAYLRSKETGDARLAIYGRMERLVQLAQAVERSDPAILAASDGPSGLWQIELEPLDTHGLMKLVVEGQLATGSYRMSNGNRGSLRGTWAGGRLDLDVVHSELGRIGKLEGTLDDTATLGGRWNSMEVGSGDAAAGTWRAFLISDDASLDLGE